MKRLGCSIVVVTELEIAVQKQESAYNKNSSKKDGIGSVPAKSGETMFDLYQ